MLETANYTFLFDATIFIDLYRCQIRNETHYNNVADFIEEIKDSGFPLLITTPVFLEVIKHLRCGIYKGNSVNEFKKKIKKLRRFINFCEINIINFTYDEVKKFIDLLQYFDTCMCDCDVGELSLLTTHNIDELIILSSDNKCFQQSDVKFADPRDYDGSGAFHWLGI